MLQTIVFGAIMFFAAFTKGLAGFGQALVAVPLLVGIIGVQTTAPVMSLFGFVSNIYLLIRHREALKWDEVWRLSVTSMIAVPIGVWGLKMLNETVVLALLGVVLIGYSLYALLGPRLPRIRNKRSSFFFGACSGLLSGAFNTGGPPVVIYGTCRGWDPAEFKGNLQAFFMLNSVMTVSSHLISGNYTGPVLRYFALAMPFLVAGMLLGSRMDRYLDPVQFRKMVLVLLIILGVTLIV